VTIGQTLRINGIVVRFEDILDIAGEMIQVPDEEQYE